jgi:hypothetical protein
MRKLITTITLCISIISCKNNVTTEKDFLAKIEVEKKSTEKNDSLFLGYYLGMPKKEFYDLSWNLNGQHTIREGRGNVSISYKPEGFSSPVTMLFYPTFYNEKVVHMPVKFTFDSWDPIKKDHWSNKLISEAAKYFEKIWGQNFFLVDTEKYGKTFQSVKNNRYVRMRLQDEHEVFVDIFDTKVTADSINYNK